MRTLEIRCDNCGTTRRTDQRQQTWYLLEDQSDVMRTGPIDLCSLKCVHDWSVDPDVVQRLPDRPEPEGTDGV